MLYLDASVLVALFAPDEHNEDAQQWIRGREGALIGVSRWGDIEFVSVLSAKGRAGAVSRNEKKEILNLYRQSAPSFARLDIAEREFAEAVRLGEVGAVALRGADALHLAIASTYGATLCTLDTRQAQAGEALGISVERLGPIS
jgi:predicted nucleic acid-binding protein